MITERLSSQTGMNDAGDIVPIDDIPDGYSLPLNSELVARVAVDQREWRYEPEYHEDELPQSELSPLEPAAPIARVLQGEGISVSLVKRAEALEAIIGFLNRQGQATGFAESLEKLDPEVVSRLRLGPYDELDRISDMQQTRLSGAEEGRDDFNSAVSILSQELELQSVGMPHGWLRVVMATDYQLAIELERELGYQRSNANNRKAVLVAAKKLPAYCP